MVLCCTQRKYEPSRFPNIKILTLVITLFLLFRPRYKSYNPGKIFQVMVGLGIPYPTMSPTNVPTLIPTTPTAFPSIVPTAPTAQPSLATASPTSPTVTVSNIRFGGMQSKHLFSLSMSLSISSMIIYDTLFYFLCNNLPANTSSNRYTYENRCQRNVVGRYQKPTDLIDLWRLPLYRVRGE